MTGVRGGLNVVYRDVVMALRRERWGGGNMAVMPASDNGGWNQTGKRDSGDGSGAP